jgi:hypothetical protein
MTISRSIIQNSPNRITYKIVGTAGADTTTIALKTALSITATGNVTFSKANKTIVRASGSWTANGVVPGATIYVSGTTSNNGAYSVISATATTLDVMVENLVDEVAATATITGAISDIAFAGQPFLTPLVNIAGAQHSLGGSCLVARNSVNVMNLFGTWMDKSAAFGMAEQNDQNITVTFGTAGGTVILELSKVGGFLPEAQRTDHWRA